MRALDADEEATARLLERAGLRRLAARALAALLRGGGHTASELAGATGLARQDVSDAARELETLGLVRVEKLATGGRPQHRYHLERGAIATLVAARRRALAEESAALDALEARFA